MVTIPSPLPLVTLAIAAALHAGPVRACPYEAELAQSGPVTAARVDESQAAHCAHGENLVGANCSYTTGLMARRVIAEGRDWSWVGPLARTGNDLPSQVAAPYAARSTGSVAYVVANELLETLVASGNASALLNLQGRTLDVGGVTYVVLTSFRAVSP